MGKKNIIKWGKKGEEEEKRIDVEAGYGHAKGLQKVKDFLKS